MMYLQVTDVTGRVWKSDYQEVTDKDRDDIDTIMQSIGDLSYLTISVNGDLVYLNGANVVSICAIEGR